MSAPAAIVLDDALVRAWTPADEPAFAAVLASSEAHLRRWTPRLIDGKVPGQTLAERLASHAEKFASGEEWVYGVFDAAGTVLGGCGLYPRIGPGAMEVGYWLAAHATGRGLATRAARALVGASFAMPGIERVEIRCEAANLASARVPQRLGFQLAPQGVIVESVELQVWTLCREARAT
jgi:RimJ/RimL family protein N-acetyltransferase